MKKNLQDIREYNMELNEVAANLDKHEAVCAERWKTAFNKFSDVETQINRIETIMIGVAGTLNSWRYNYNRNNIVNAPLKEKI